MRIRWQQAVTGLSAVVVAGTFAAADVQAQNGSVRSRGDRQAELRQRPHYSEVPLSSLSEEEQAASRQEIEEMRTRGHIATPQNAMPPPD